MADPISSPQFITGEFSLGEPYEPPLSSPPTPPVLDTSIDDAETAKFLRQAPAPILVQDDVTGVDEQIRLQASGDLDGSYARAEASRLGIVNDPYANETAKLARQGTPDQNRARNSAAGDWRVKIRLAKNANYLYNLNGQASKILAPLAADGVVFPYTPNITVNYNANYEPLEPAHTNYKLYQYKNSSVGEIQIQADFTAQDLVEARYMLAVIYFFKSVTKMFYGNDLDPINGSPPPLCFLSGYGGYQFDEHPLVISSFNYALPPDIDYIKVDTEGSSIDGAGANQSQYQYKVNSYIPSLLRKASSGLATGDDPIFKTASVKNATYVPTKIQMSLTCLPIVTRHDISNNFSLNKYGTGELNRGSKRGGGIW